MKKLTLLRHAKSSWEDPLLSDFDRPLNKRGKRNASLMGRRLTVRNCMPQRILSSPAKRASKTARLIAEEIGYDRRCIDYDQHIYEADVMTLLELVRSLEGMLNDVMLVGHNPGLTDLANLLADLELDNIVTCGVVCLDFPVNSWSDIELRSGALQFYDYPKRSGKV